ncbi:sugar ABC transporter substrate-binding protein [Paenibacillus naphthalenovorans]|uniref:sugar ABC transporter substrate-binding protein n=1 Tax=Paenibacillus naphthalenovorans TaxID=162209 RepID=UPI003D288D2E
MNSYMSRRQFLKKMTKWTVLGVGLCLNGTLLAACEKSITGGGLNLEDPDAEEQKPFIFFSNRSLGYYFYIIQQEAVNRAAQSIGWGFQSSVADFDPSKQDQQIRDILAKKPVAVVADPVDSEGLEETMSAARREAIPVGIIDTPLMTGEASITIAFDNYKAGEMAAQKIIELLTEKYGTPKGIVLNCFGQLKSHAWNLRKQGFEAVLQTYEDVELISRATEGDLTKMHDVTAEILSQFPQLDAVHAPSETPARGIYQALKEKGRLHPKGSKEHVIFVTIDGEPIAHQWIKEGILDATISQDPIAYGEICVELLNKYARQGKEVPLEQYSNSKYYWEKAQIMQTASGPSLILPPFEVNTGNVDDKRLWGNIAFNDWGIKYY